MRIPVDTFSKISTFAPPNSDGFERVRAPKRTNPLARAPGCIQRNSLRRVGIFKESRQIPFHFQK